MPLITVFFPGPRKAIIDPKHKEYFLNLGAVETQAEAEEDNTRGAMLNPDKGFGRPGDLQWHILQVHNCRSKYAVYKYGRSVLGKGCDRRQNIEGCRSQTIEMIREYLENGKGS